MKSELIVDSIAKSLRRRVNNRAARSSSGPSLDVVCGHPGAEIATC